MGKQTSLEGKIAYQSVLHLRSKAGYRKGRSTDSRTCKSGPNQQPRIHDAIAISLRYSLACAINIKMTLPRTCYYRKTGVPSIMRLADSCLSALSLVPINSAAPLGVDDSCHEHNMRRKPNNLAMISCFPYPYLLFHTQSEPEPLLEKGLCTPHTFGTNAKQWAIPTFGTTMSFHMRRRNVGQ